MEDITALEEKYGHIKARLGVIEEEVSEMIDLASKYSDLEKEFNQKQLLGAYYKVSLLINNARGEQRYQQERMKLTSLEIVTSETYIERYKTVKERDQRVRLMESSVRKMDAYLQTKMDNLQLLREVIMFRIDNNRADMRE